MNPSAIDRIERQSVQVLPDAKVNGSASATSDFWLDGYARGELLPAPYTYECERWLRWYDQHNAAALWHGAKSGQVKKVGATGYTMTGGRNLVAYFDEVFRYSQFARGGFATMIEMIFNDYLVFNRGGFMEIIAPGNPMRPPTGRITGLAHLDAYHCMPTGDPQYPVLYTDRDGKQHLMHHTRVVQFIDTPQGDQNHPGFGRSALWRSIHILWQEVLMGRYTVASLDDKPPPGMVLVSGMSREKWNAVWEQYSSEQSMDERPAWGKNVPIFGLDPTVKPEVTMIPFSVAPEKFDYKLYTELNVHKLALAMGVDVQELWELTGNSLGSGQQSEVQHSKSQGKLYGEFLSTFERAMNNYVLPPSLEFEFEVRDPMEAQQEAANAQVWVGVATSAQAVIGRENAAQLMADTVEALAKVLLDDDGQMTTLPDNDPQDPAQQGQDVQVGDEAPTSDAPATSKPTTAQDATPNAKAFADTRSQFIADLSDLLSTDVDRRRAGVVMRAQIARLGRQSYADGLKAGGVEDAPTGDDLAAVTALIAEQNQYVAPFLDSAYSSGLTDDQIAAHADMWANKSLQAFFDAGLLSADANGMYQWQVGLTEHCKTCMIMSGQKHRLKDYNLKGIYPRSGLLACGGYRCACSLIRTSGRAMGGWAPIGR